MKKALRAVSILLFSTFLLAPLVLTVLGWVEAPYGMPQTSWPKISGIFALDPKGRKALSNAIFERSPIKKIAIKSKYFADLNIFGYVNSPGIISGVDGWLFYREQFGPTNYGKYDSPCQLEPNYRFDLLDIWFQLISIMRKSGLEVYLSVAPDKATVYPEFLDSRFAKSTRCKILFAAWWRETLRRKEIPIIDLLEPILAHKSDGSLLYHKTDTHWTDRGSFIALRELAQILGASGDFATKPKYTKQIYNEERYFLSDLGDQLLQFLPNKENIYYRKNNISLFNNKNRVYKKMVILHDSYLKKAGILVNEFFPNSEMVSFTYLKFPQFAKLVDNAEVLLINSVERLFFRRVENYFSIFLATVSRALNRRIPHRCEDPLVLISDGAVKRLISYRNVIIKGSTLSVTTGDPILVFDVPFNADFACVDVEIESPHETTFELLFNDEGHPFNQRRFPKEFLVSYDLLKGVNKFRLLVPMHFSKDLLRIDPAKKAGQYKFTKLVISKFRLN